MRYSARAEVLYLDRADRYKTEKPYELAFDAAVSVYDASSTKAEFTLAEHGFQLMDDRTKLDPEDFADLSQITSTYYNEMKESVRRALGRPAEMFVVNHRVRRRNPDYPNVSTDGNTDLQPISSVHTGRCVDRIEGRIDFSPVGAKPYIDQLVREHPYLASYENQVINIWRLLRGPTSDWPLAVCDYRSIDLERDIECSDKIGKSHIIENVFLYENPRHKWYFFAGQTFDQLLFFNNCSSSGWHVPFSPHVAFDWQSDSLPKLPRESIEVRVACFFPPEA